MAVTLSHRGICVSDIARSMRFYAEALDFVPDANHDDLSGALLDQTCEIDGVRLRGQMMRHPSGVTIELLHFYAPPAFGPRERRPTNQYGLVHLSFTVDDIDAAADRLRAAGGHVFDHTRAYFPDGDATMLYCTDPDGVRIELMKLPGRAPGFSHSGICVDDIDRSLAYYAALGFDAAENFELTDHASWLGVINEIDGIKLRAQMVRDAAGNTIELLKVYEPGSFGPRERRALNQIGLTHLAFWTDDIDGAADALRRQGGTFADRTRVRMGGVELYQGGDPDGVRIELMKQIG